jgi:hypothetical protein
MPDDDKMDELEEFFCKNPEDAKFEIEKPDEAMTADTKVLEKLTMEKGYKKTEFEQRADIGFNKFVSDTRRWVRKDNDVIICVSGPEGSGKSRFIVCKLAKALDPNFYLERNVLFRPTPESLEKRIFEINRYGVLVLDEAMETMYKRQSSTSGNIGINKLFGRVRKFNRIVILALPDFNDLDAFFRKRRVRVRFEIIERGLGFLMVSKHLTGNADPWFTDYNAKILTDSFDEEDLTKSTGLEKLAVYEKFRCFVSPILWDADPEDEEMWKRYNELAMESQLNSQMEESYRKEKLSKPDKAYRMLFQELSKRFMEEHKYTHDEAYVLLTKMFGGKLPFDAKSFRFMTTEKKDWKAQKKEVRMLERRETKEKATKLDGNNTDRDRRNGSNRNGNVYCGQSSELAGPVEIFWRQKHETETRGSRRNRRRDNRARRERYRNRRR